MPIEIERPQRAKGMVHKRIADLAKALAAEHFDQLSSIDAFHAAWPLEKPFIGHHWRLYVPMARQFLAAQLGNPKIPQAEKEAVFKALLLDGTVNPKRMAEPEKPRFFTGPTGGA